MYAVNTSTQMNAPRLFMVVVESESEGCSGRDAWVGSQCERKETLHITTHDVAKRSSLTDVSTLRLLRWPTDMLAVFGCVGLASGCVGSVSILS